MRNKVFAFLFIMLILPTFAVTSNDYNDFFSFDSNTKLFVFVNFNKVQLKTLDKGYLKNYKIARKLNKLYTKNKNEKILKTYPNFVPSLFASYEYNYDKENYNLALENLKDIKLANKNFNNDYLQLAFYKTYYAMGEYSLALSELLKLQNINDSYFLIADCYLNLGEYDNSIIYASKVSQNQKDYPSALEIIFKSYFFVKKKL